MRIRIFVLLVTVSLLAASVPMFAGNLAGGGDPFTIWFDENGNGSISLNGDPAIPNPGLVFTDPLSGINALAYVLPEVVADGDVRIWDDPGATVLSDLLRFENGVTLPGGQVDTVMFYFSQAGGPSLADTGFPSVINPNDGGGLFEWQVGGVSGFDWYPGGNVYHGISDTPEPGTLLMFGSGIAGLAAMLRRKINL